MAWGQGAPGGCQQGWDLGLDGTEMRGHVSREAGLHAFGMNQQVSWGKGGVSAGGGEPRPGDPNRDVRALLLPTGGPASRFVWVAQECNQG